MHFTPEPIPLPMSLRFRVNKNEGTRDYQLMWVRCAGPERLKMSRSDVIIVLFFLFILQRYLKAQKNRKEQ